MTAGVIWDPHNVKLGKMNVTTQRQQDMTDSDEMLKSIDPSLIMLKEMTTRHIQANNYIDVTAEDIPAQR